MQSSVLGKKFFFSGAYHQLDNFNSYAMDVRSKLVQISGLALFLTFFYLEFLIKRKQFKMAPTVLHTIWTSKCLELSNFKKLKFKLPNFRGVIFERKPLRY